MRQGGTVTCREIVRMSMKTCCPFTSSFAHVTAREAAEGTFAREADTPLKAVEP